MNSLLLIPNQDFLKIGSVALPVEFAVIPDSGADASDTDNTVQYSMQELSTRCIGAVALSVRGREILDTFVQQMTDISGTDPMTICDLSSRGKELYEQVLLSFVASALVVTVERQARSVTVLSRSLTVMRKLHDSTQAAFSRLEKFVFENNLAARTETLCLMPGKHMEPARLAAGETLTQRLPISSEGLCDIALFVEEVEESPLNALWVTLRTEEDDAVRAHWTVPNATITGGPIRFAMRTALDTEALTPIVEIGWSGAGCISLGIAMPHPEPRYQLVLDDQLEPRVLALRCWKYLPGSEAPLPVNAVAPEPPDTKPIRYRVIDNLVLENVIDLTPENQHSKHLPNEQALLVHPMSQGISVMKLPEAVPDGAVHISARVCTSGEKAENIQYAIGIAAIRGRRPAPPGSTPDSAVETLSEWITLKAGETGQVHLPLIGPLIETHDLFFLTRLENQPGDASWGWATFDRIRITFT